MLVQGGAQALRTVQAERDPPGAAAFEQFDGSADAKTDAHRTARALLGQGPRGRAHAQVPSADVAPVLEDDALGDGDEHAFPGSSVAALERERMRERVREPEVHPFPFAAHRARPDSAAVTAMFVGSAGSMTAAPGLEGRNGVLEAARGQGRHVRQVGVDDVPVVGAPHLPVVVLPGGVRVASVVERVRDAAGTERPVQSPFLRHGGAETAQGVEAPPLQVVHPPWTGIPVDRDVRGTHRDAREDPRDHPPPSIRPRPRPCRRRADPNATRRPPRGTGG